MKRTCNGCKALEEFGCSLGYETIEKSKSFKGFPTIYIRKPLEECPKPKTIREYMNINTKRSDK